MLTEKENKLCIPERGVLLGLAAIGSFGEIGPPDKHIVIEHMEQPVKEVCTPSQSCPPIRPRPY
jgi:hypothetical protein